MSFWIYCIVYYYLYFCCCLPISVAVWFFSFIITSIINYKVLIMKNKLVELHFFRRVHVLQVFIKRFLKRNLAHVGMIQWMHWLTKYKNKTCHAHSDMHSITSVTTLFNNHPYISSSKFSAANWRATATYVGMVVE